LNQMIFKATGHYLFQKCREFSYFAGFFYRVLKESFFLLRNKNITYKVLVMQILFTGVEALGIISLISLGIGAAIIIQGNALLPRFGQSSLLYSILIMVITRELGPMITAFIITARSGNAITTELGNMMVSHEVEAYVSVGIDPIAYLAVPRMLGVIIALFFLNIYSNIFGLMGSYIVANLVSPLSLVEYFSGLLSTLTVMDLMSTLIKSIVFGIIISVVSVYYGFSVSGAVTEVPQKTIKSIGLSITLCIVADLLIVLITRL